MPTDHLTSGSAFSNAKMVNETTFIYLGRKGAKKLLLTRSEYGPDSGKQQQ